MKCAKASALDYGVGASSQCLSKIMVCRRVSSRAGPYEQDGDAAGPPTRAKRGRPTNVLHLTYIYIHVVLWYTLTVMMLCEKQLYHSDEKRGIRHQIKIGGWYEVRRDGSGRPRQILLEGTL